jgi:hypothetical protein
VGVSPATPTGASRRREGRVLFVSATALAFEPPDSGKWTAAVYKGAYNDGDKIAECGDDAAGTWCKRPNISPANTAGSVKICNNTGVTYEYYVNVYNSDDYRNNLGWPSMVIPGNQCGSISFVGALSDLNNRMNSMQIVPIRR